METFRSDDMDADSDVIEIIPVEEYDVLKAKVKASLSWVLCKAYQDKVPAEFQDPFYETGEGNWQIKPRLANILANSDVYCQACKNMFGENASQWQGHWSIIQVLSRKGIYAVGSDSVDVTETVLMQSAPFKIKAHLALIDALMQAFACEIVTIERVTQCVRRFASFNASSELPSDTEDAILFWINKVCVTVQKIQEKAKDTVIEGGETSQKVRIVSSKTPRDSISVPIMESLLTDMGDGCSLATLISFYCPQILQLEDICLKSNVGIADSLYNLRLIKTFCDRHLPYKTCHFSFEDLLYTHQSVRQNVVMMIAELYYWFEIKPLSIVTGAGITQASGDSKQVDRPHTAGRLQSSSKIPDVAISQVTKQSFQRLKGDSELRASSTHDIHKLSPSAPLPHRMPLLHKRQQQGQGYFHDEQSTKESMSGVHQTITQDRRVIGPPTQSTVAWPELSQNQVNSDHQQQPPLHSDRSGISNNLLSNVSIDSEMNASFSSGSIDLGELDPTPRLDTDRSHFDQVQNNEESPMNFGKSQKQKTPFPGKNQMSFTEDSEAETSLSHEVTWQSEHYNNDRNDSLTENDIMTPKGVNLEPLMPARLKPAKEKTNNHSKEEERGERPKRKTPSPPKLKSKSDLGSDTNKSDDKHVENNADMLPAGHLLQAHGQSFDALQHELAQKKYEAFFIRGSVDESQDLPTHRSDVTVAESYVVDKSKTPEAARAAGLPIIDDSALSPRRLSREGSVASSKSSGDFSDHESHKIHSDHKTRETVYENNNVNKVNLNNFQSLSNPADVIMQKPVIVSHTQKEADKAPKGLSTNFAQIRQMKQYSNVDNSGFVFMQHGREGEGQSSSLKDAFQKKKAEKKASFAPLPNQTTWGQSSSGASTNHDEADGATANGTASQELLKIRMKLEEKRKAIERKKHTQEIQQQKIRQRLGKAAFLHVVSKTKDDESVPTSGGASDSNPPARMTSSDPEIPVLSPRRDQEQRAPNSSLQEKPAYNNKSNRPFSRDDIQQTIENVRKKWFNDEELVAPTVMEQSDPDSSEMSRSQSSTHSDRPTTLDDLETYDARQRNEEVARRPVVFDRRSASVEKITSLTDRGDSSERAQFRESSPRARETSPQVRENRTHAETKDRRSASIERYETPSYSTLSSQRGRDDARRDVSLDKRIVSVEPGDVKPDPSSSPRQIGQDVSSEKKPETYQEYNNSLDKLNQSLSDLQGEIMKLSLKQRKPEPATRSRSGSRSPPHHLEIGSKTLPSRSKESAPDDIESPRSRSAQHTHSQHRSASEPRQVQPESTNQTQIGQYQSSTLPRHPTSFHQNQQVPQPHYMVQNPVAGPTGPVYGNPNQYIPMSGQAGIPPSAQQYGSYIMGPNPQQPLAQIPQPPVTAPFQHSPPHMFPTTATMYPGQPYPTQPIVSPQTQAFPSMYPSPPHTQFQQPIPVPHAGTHTTTIHSHQIPFTPTTQPFDPYMYQQQQTHQTPFTNYSDSSSINGTVNTSNREVLPPSDGRSGSSENTMKSSPKQTVSQSRNKSIVTNEVEDDSSVEAYPANEKGGFFVAMNEGSPRRVKNKPHISDKKQKGESVKNVIEDKSRLDSSVIADFAQKVEEEQNNSCERRELESTKDEVEDKLEPAVGFIIGQDETSLDETTEEEMQKKKDKIERMRQKRHEEQERKRLKLEQEMTRKRELERQRQEESERRKSEEKARREQIFKQYLEKKEEEEEKPSKREKPKPKSRPKSMFVKGADLSEGGEACSSNEDLSARAFTIPTGGNNSSALGPRGKLSRPSTRQNMRKAVSCNTLPQNGSMSASADSKSLAFGGLTHRRPPSPDLYGKQRKGNRSNESSDAGSAHGSDYSGPKLFVKPSAKSNRHIIINAISHCCLAGSVNTEHKNKVLEEVAKSNAKHFIILFRDTSCGYRGLYGFDPDTEDCVKICGVGPRAISHEAVEKYYKYNSGGKSFSEVKSTKHISVSIDAVNLQNYVWKQGNKAPAKGHR